MSSQLCRDCQCYCIYCQICHKDFDYREYNDTCKDFVPENNINDSVQFPKDEGKTE